MTKNIPLQNINWSAAPKVECPGEISTETWQTTQFEGLRVRIVEYSAGYKADHWCQKGHIVHCLEGEVVNELKEQNDSFLKANQTKSSHE